MRLTELPGLPSEIKSRLEAIGFHTCQQLLRAVQRREQLPDLIGATGLPPPVVQAIVQMAELTEVRGVGPAVLQQLCQAGINSLDALAALEPEHLQARLQRVSPTARPPNLAVIEDWILQARRKAGKRPSP